MFPMPIEKWKPINRALYRASLPVALLIISNTAFPRM